MLTRLRLSHFQGFRETNVELKRLSVIVGPNCSGKTSILRAIWFLLIATDYAVQRQTVTFSTDVPLLPMDRLRIASWNDLFYRDEHISSTTAVLNADFDASSAVRAVQVTLLNRGEAPPEVVVELQQATETRGIVDRTPLVASLLSQISQIPPQERYLSDADVLSLQRMGRHAEVLRNLLARMEPRAVDWMNRILQRGNQPTMVAHTPIPDLESDAPIRIQFQRPHGARFELASANDGLLNLVGVLASLGAEVTGANGRANTVVLCDEPEAHLHPRLQGALGTALANFATERHAQIISVTHSMPLAYRMGCRPNGILLQLDGRFRGTDRLNTEEDRLEAFGRTHDLTSYATINFLTHRRFLFHEGPTDYQILSRSALAYFGPGSEEYRAFETWTHRDFGGVTKSHVTDLMSVLFEHKLLPQLTERDAIMVVTVTDRDYNLKKEPSESRKRQLIHRRKVWRRHSIESLFLDRNVLIPLVSTALAEIGCVTIHEIEKLMCEAIAKADVCESLLSEAEVCLAAALRATDGEQARATASRMVRSAPEVWQRGKSREKFIFDEIRTSMPLQLQKHLRRTIAEILEAMSTEQLMQIVVPIELREFLEDLVDWS